MWQKILVIVFLFCFFALLQGSFFAHFDFFGAKPNLVFILFFLLSFFQDDPKGVPKTYQIIFLATIAGFFLDIFSYTYLGPSIILLIIIGFILKSAQSLLKNMGDSHPFVYFISLFFILFLVYNLALGMYLHFIDPSKIALNFGVENIFLLVYNLFFASVFFYIYKRFFSARLHD